eukprot:TRINITY_DN39776_c0_g1_i1.p1 TRINITY_DN39776_c0_g1~~TRINITY_DN39776_c0_g1_i1.p1  ORF type:complete len:235 (+),score=56.35 TRINITY_DN39776_c0_g1_i1:80-784(+)
MPVTAGTVVFWDTIKGCGVVYTEHGYDIRITKEFLSNFGKVSLIADRQVFLEFDNNGNVTRLWGAGAMCAPAQYPTSNNGVSGGGGLGGHLNPCVGVGGSSFTAGGGASAHAAPGGNVRLPAPKPQAYVAKQENPDKFHPQGAARPSPQSLFNRCVPQGGPGGRGDNAGGAAVHGGGPAQRSPTSPRAAAGHAVAADQWEDLDEALTLLRQGYNQVVGVMNNIRGENRPLIGDI